MSDANPRPTFSGLVTMLAKMETLAEHSRVRGLPDPAWSEWSEQADAAITWAREIAVTPGASRWTTIGVGGPLCGPITVHLAPGQELWLRETQPEPGGFPAYMETRDRPVIEVTPAMIEAGVAALEGLCPFDVAFPVGGEESAVEAVLRAGMATLLQERSASGEPGAEDRGDAS